MAIDRRTFLHEALKAWYEQSNQVAQSTVANNRIATTAFTKAYAKWLEEPHTQEEWDALVKIDSTAKAYRETVDAQKAMLSYGITIAALTSGTSLTKEQYEVILEDFRARTADKVTVKEKVGDREVEKTVTVSLAEKIYTDEIGGGVTSFETKTEFGERFLSGSSKTSKIGVFGRKAPNTIEEFVRVTSLEELGRAIAIYDYNQEIEEKEMPRETVRAAQMNGIKTFSDRFAAIPDDAIEALRSAANNLFAPFSEAGRTLSVARLVEIKNAVVKAQSDLEALGSRIYTEKKGVNVDALTGDNQARFEPIYNSLFGMSNLRDRNPEVVPVYPPLSNIVINEIARRVQNETLEEGGWFESVKNNPLYPADFADRALDHAQRLLETTAAFGMVYEFPAGGGAPTIKKPEDVETTLAANPNAKTYGDMVTTAVTEYFSSDAFPEAKRNEFAKLTASQQKVVAQLVTREMTTRSFEGSDGRGIHYYLATQAIPASIQTLVEDGTFPNFSDLNKFAMTLMLNPDKNPDPAIIDGLHDKIFEGLQAEGVTDFTLGATFEHTDKVGTVHKVSFAKIEGGVISYGKVVEELVGEEKKEKVVYVAKGEKPDKSAELAAAYGSKFYHSGVYGTYGIVEQNQIAAEKAKSDEKKATLIREAAVPASDGYKFKLFTKSDYYKQKFNEYYQMYMGSGGPQQYWSMMTAENAKRSEMFGAPTPVEEEVITEEPSEETPDSNIRTAYTTLSGMHKRLVERVVGANHGVQYQNTEDGHSTLNFQAALVRNNNSKFANIVLKEVAALIEGKDPDEAAEIIRGLSESKTVDGKKVAPVLPKGVKVTLTSEGDTQVSFFGMTYSRVLDDENRPKVVAHYDREGAPVPQSTMITILTHDQPAVREIAPAYANHPENARTFEPTRSSEKPLVNDESALLGFITDPTAGPISMLTPTLTSPTATALRRGATMDGKDIAADSKLDNLNDKLAFGTDMFSEDDVPTL